MVIERVHVWTYLDIFLYLDSAHDDVNWKLPKEGNYRSRKKIINGTKMRWDYGIYITTVECGIEETWRQVSV